MFVSNRSLRWAVGLLVYSCWGIASTFADPPPTIDRPWNEDVLYFAMTDRFCDGDPSNNVPVGSDPQLHDASQTDIDRYHGGDFRGIELALREGYFNRLGVTAIWLTPPIRNAWYAPHDMGGPKTGYHGYWAQDFLDIDPHLTSATSIDGEPYSDDRDGRMAHYRDLVRLAHSRGIKIVQDAVCNHIGPLFYYDENGNGQLDGDRRDEWIAAYSERPRENTRWTDIPRWNLVPPHPDGSETVLGAAVQTTGLFRQFAIYGRHGFNPDSLGKSDGEEVRCDFFSLRDMDTRPATPHFEALVDEFVEIYLFYIREIGIDGLRLDTVKHVDHAFWSAFTSRLRNRLGDDAERLLITGEVYDGNPATLGRYTYGVDPATGERTDATCLDSLLNFQFCFNLRDYLRKRGDEFGHPWGLQNTTDSLNREGRDAFYNGRPGADGLPPRQKMVNFFENHDGLNRFLVEGVNEIKHELALAILMTHQGIPCVYYGAEAGLRDAAGRTDRDGETGRMTFCRSGDVSTLRSASGSASFRLIQRLAELRREHSALRGGSMRTLWVDSDSTGDDDGLYVFARYLPSGDGTVDSSNTVIVAINSNVNSAAVATGVSLGEGELALARGGAIFVAADGLDFCGPESSPRQESTADRIMVSDLGSIDLEVPPGSAVVYVRGE